MIDNFSKMYRFGKREIRHRDASIYTLCVSDKTAVKTEEERLLQIISIKESTNAKERAKLTRTFKSWQQIGSEVTKRNCGP